MSINSNGSVTGHAETAAEGRTDGQSRGDGVPGEPHQNIGTGQQAPPVLPQPPPPPHQTPPSQPLRSQPTTVLAPAAALEIDAVDTSIVFSQSSYVYSQLSVLVARHAQIRGDLLVSAGTIQYYWHTDVYVNRVRDYLNQARDTLQAAHPTLPVAANQLAMAERALIWLYPPQILNDKCRLVRENLAELRPKPEELLKQLDEVMTERLQASVPRVDPAASGTDGAGWERDLRVRQVLSDATSYLHQNEESSLIEDDLQVTRLRKVRLYLIVALFLTMVAVQFSVVPNVDANGKVFWPVFASTSFETWVLLLIGSLGIAVFGAVGGIISGMLRVRDSKALLSQYRTSLLLLSLRPLIGAIAALSLYLFLSWNTISGISVTNPGTYVLVAFVAGFSERFFIGMLRGQEDQLAKASTVKAA